MAGPAFGNLVSRSVRSTGNEKSKFWDIKQNLAPLCASALLHSAILPPSPEPQLPTQSTETPHLPKRVVGHNLGSSGSLLGLRPAIERTQRAQTNQPTPVA